MKQYKLYAVDESNNETLLLTAESKGIACITAEHLSTTIYGNVVIRPTSKSELALRYKRQA
jgi:hypothetical protein